MNSQKMILSGRKRGFTLVEMLVVLAVMGVISAISIPVLTNTNYSAKETRNLRNAQTAVMVYAAAVASGATFSSGSGDIAGVISELNIGKAGGGALSSSIFKMPAVDSESSAAMIPLLDFNYATGGLTLR